MLVPRILSNRRRIAIGTVLGLGINHLTGRPLPRLVSLGSERPCQALAIATHLPPSVAINITLGLPT